MAEAIAQQTGCTVAEPMWYGSHPYNHLGMPGTVVVPEDAFLANLRAVISRGVPVDLARPWPERGPLPGERVGSWATETLTWDLVNP